MYGEALRARVAEYRVHFGEYILFFALTLICVGECRPGAVFAHAGEAGGGGSAVGGDELYRGVDGCLGGPRDGELAGACKRSEERRAGSPCHWTGSRTGIVAAARVAGEIFLSACGVNAAPFQTVWSI